MTAPVTPAEVLKAAVRKRRKNPETPIVNTIREWLQWHGWTVFRHQQGMGSHPGFSDLTAIKDGLTVYVEVKTTKGRQSDDQKLFQWEIEQAGGRYILARGIEDLEGL